MSAESASDVSGPVAMIQGEPSGSGTAVISPRVSVISGCDDTASVTTDEKRTRSTARAPPAGTRAASAPRMTIEPSRRISSLSRPTAFSSESPRNELLQTSSARWSVLWTSVGRTGRISCSTTGTPREATCQAASEPASPPPMMLTFTWLLMVVGYGLRVAGAAELNPQPAIRNRQPTKQPPPSCACDRQSTCGARSSSSSARRRGPPAARPPAPSSADRGSRPSAATRSSCRR